MISSLLSWLHQFTVNVCPGGWPWTVSLAGALLAMSPVLGAVLLALVRKGTGNRYSGGTTIVFGVFGLMFGLVLPWTIITMIDKVFRQINEGQPVGMTSADLASLHGNACFISGFGTQQNYLGGGQTVYEELFRSTGNHLVLGVYLTVLVILPALCLFAVMVQQRVALRRGPKWPGRLAWLPFLAFLPLTAPLKANLVGQFWVGFLPASLVGILVVYLFGAPPWSAINRSARERPQPRDESPPYLPPPPPPRAPYDPTLMAGQPLSQRTSAPPLASMPGPLPVPPRASPMARWTAADGRFQRIHQLGHGGFGTVWLVKDTQLGRTVALKLAHAPDDETQQRMLREARALAAVHHPNCVHVYDIIEDADGLGIVMEYVDGHPLSNTVAEGRVLDDVAAARLWTAMAGALDAAHRQGVLHRDVKPSNVMLDGAGVSHLIDFGIARAKGDATLTAAGITLGTPDFLAPETAASGVATPASDAWQLAATVNYALTGQPPRGRRENPMSALMAAAQRLPNTHLPARSRHRDLLRAALDAEPGRRPTLLTVQRELGSWLAGGGHPTDGPIATTIISPTAAPRQVR